MLESTDPWFEIISSALVELGADTKMTRGAALQSLVSVKANSEDLNLVSYLREFGMKFSELLERYKDSITVVRVPGTDMFVGTKGAVLSEELSSTRHDESKYLRLRQDVYDAFTRLDRNHCYRRSTDRFVELNQLELGEDLISVPPVNVESLIADRRAYAEQLADANSKESLIESLRTSDHTLGRFQRVVSDLSLRRDWHAYKFKQLVEAVRAWSVENSVEFGNEWIVGIPSSSARSPQQILGMLARHMSDDEVRGLRIPFRVVEQLIRSLDRKRSP